MRHLIPALRIFLLNVVASIYLQLDTVMLGFLKGNEAVGYYTGAIKLTKMLMGITSSLCVVLCHVCPIWWWRMNVRNLSGY